MKNLDFLKYLRAQEDAAYERIKLGHFYNFVNSSDGTKGVLFIATQTQGNPWDLIVYPQDAVNYLETTYRLGNKTAGRWYCLGAEQKTVQEGSFRVAFAQWQEGE